MHKQEINNAISEHAIWKFNLNDMIQRGKLVKPVPDSQDNECEFGKWFYGTSVAARQKSSVHYKRVKELHTEFHKVAARVADLASEGKKDEAEKLMSFEGEFTAISNRLMEELIRWKDRV